MSNKNFAFTMAEALIVLAVVGVLASISVVSVAKAKPDENIIMYRRAYKVTVTAIRNLLNDTDLYPNANNEINTSSILGSANNKLGLCDSTKSNNFAQNFMQIIHIVMAKEYICNPHKQKKTIIITKIVIDHLVKFIQQIIPFRNILYP